MQCNLADAIALVIPPFLAYDQAMRFLAVITLLILVMAQPVAAQTFKPNFRAGTATATMSWTNCFYLLMVLMVSVCTAIKSGNPFLFQGAMSD